MSDNFDKKLTELSSLTWTEQEKQSTFEKVKNSKVKRTYPVKYYVAVATACILTLILISPMLVQFFEGENEFSLQVKDVTDLRDSEFAVLFWIDADKDFEHRVTLENDDERLIEMSEHLQQLEVTEVDVFQETRDQAQFLISFVHNDIENSFTIVYFDPTGKIRLFFRDKDLEGEYFISNDLRVDLYEMVNAIIREEQLVVKDSTAQYFDLCGWDEDRTNIILDDNYTHPIPCIQPILGGDSIVVVQSFGPDEFLYREWEEANREQVVSVSIVGENVVLAGSATVIKEADDYQIVEQVNLTDGEDDVTIIGKGTLNEDYNFHIAFHDRKNDFTVEEIINKIERVIDELRSSQ